MANKKHNPDKKKKVNVKEQNLLTGINLINSHALFGHLAGELIYREQRVLGRQATACVNSDGSIVLNKDILLMPKQWAYVIAHCRLHLAFGHFDAGKMPGYEITDASGTAVWKPDFKKPLWNTACDIYIAKFLADIKFGESICPDPTMEFPIGLTDENVIYDYLVEHGFSEQDHPYGTAAPTSCDMIGLERPLVYEKGKSNPCTAQFALALSYSTANAVRTAGGHRILDYTATGSQATRAAAWFVNHYPLLGGLAAGFKVIDDVMTCQRYDIRVAAIDVTIAEIYVNPAAGLSDAELRFVLAHEFLHAGLQHHERRCGRDPYLWNIACDYVINGWLVEMGIGVIPSIGLLYDEDLKGESAETIYDRIVQDLRKYRKLNTFRGYGQGDIIESGKKKPGAGGPAAAGGMTLDEFYKSALAQGLEYHISDGRGFVPAGMIEEIRALAMPPIPWDVKLARWFEAYFPPPEKPRSYARPSRRQASTPDIPRPNYIRTEQPEDARTFGVVIDTSGSMSTRMIGQALGSIASYAAAREVPYARVIFCDAMPCDAGYLSPDDITGRVKVVGRGGTVLQPAVDLLERAEDFPKRGPVLIITDGWIEETFTVHNPHAYLIPAGMHLPFRAKGDVFYFTES